MRRITVLPYAAVVASPLPLFPLNTPLVPGLVLPLHMLLVTQMQQPGMTAVRNLLLMMVTQQQLLVVLRVRARREDLDTGRGG